MSSHNPVVSAVFMGPASSSTMASSHLAEQYPLPMYNNTYTGGAVQVSAAAGAGEVGATVPDVPAHTVLLCDHDNGTDGSTSKAEHHPPISISGNNAASQAATRHRQPRLSLHGKTVNSTVRHPRRDARYRKVQAKIYNFLERPRGVRAISYHMLVFALVFGCFCLTVLSTVPDFEDSTQQPLFWMELIVVVWFTVEFLLRMWSVGCRSRYQGFQGRMQFFKRPFTIIDTIVIVASIVVLGIGSHGQVFAASALRGLRFFQILRMVRMDRRGGTWKLLGSVVWAHRQELLTTFYIGFLGLIFSSFLIYLVEKDTNDRFLTFADALWWGVITLATVGYGDSVPATWKGKLIAGVCAMMGISFFALPASILGSGFALKVQQQQRQKHLIRRRNPAALLIQCIWRCYAADERSCSVATWEPHLRGLKQQHSVANLASHVPSKFHASSTSFVSRFSTIKRPKHLPNHVFATSGGSSSHGPHFHLNKRESSAGASLPHVKSSSASDLLKRDNSARKTFSAPIDLSLPNHRPPDGNAQPHLLLQHRRMALTQPEDIRRAMEDEEDTVSIDSPPPELSDKQRTAIRAIRKMKYFVAKRKFREALKPYDVKDVIEQYSAGHVDLLARVKNLQQRCDQLLGKQNSKTLDAYDSKVCLAARVVKIERQVDDIEGKVDTILEILMQQRNHRILDLGGSNAINLHNPISRSRSDTESGAPPPRKLRPILMNSQQQQSPASDTAFLSIPDENGGGRPQTGLARKTVKLQVTRGHSSLGLVNTVEEELKPHGGGMHDQTAHSETPFLSHNDDRPTDSLPSPYTELSGLFLSDSGSPSARSESVIRVGCEDAGPTFIDAEHSSSENNAEVQFV
ncbi:Potassium voltage-gated channel subfamily KQT member 5 [Hypsibius exemplaris]|uniref:Potassium voltage-gated channel subfamily KQT member 5 n=1 Tax=Hypsibius exemplaris TaxID=2072580 RepID=A0A9X6NC71_HYPEX|nr:Potassium voltage-gated channel subfamily KQT member 5 [Hypsibius exemplaris]